MNRLSHSSLFEHSIIIIIIIIIITLSPRTNKITVNIHHGETHQAFYEHLERLWTEKFLQKIEWKSELLLTLIRFVQTCR